LRPKPKLIAHNRKYAANTPQIVCSPCAPLTIASSQSGTTSIAKRKTFAHVITRPAIRAHAQPRAIPSAVMASAAVDAYAKLSRIGHRPVNNAPIGQSAPRASRAAPARGVPSAALMTATPLTFLLPVFMRSSVACAFVTRISRLIRRRARVAFANALQEIVAKHTHINIPSRVSVVGHCGICVEIVLAGTKHWVIPRTWAIAIRESRTPSLPGRVSVRLHV